MQHLNLQDLFQALKNHYNDYGYDGCGLGTTLDCIIDELIDSGHSKKLIKKICNYAYYS